MEQTTKDAALEYAATVMKQVEQERDIACRSAIYRLAGKLSFLDVCRLGRRTLEAFADVCMAGDEFQS